METMVAKKIPCVVVSRNLAPTPEMIEVLEKYKVPLFKNSLSSKAFTTEVTMLLEERLHLDLVIMVLFWIFKVWEL